MNFAQGRSKGGAHSDIKKKKKRTVPSCDSVPIVHVNEPFNRIGSFVNVTTLPSYEQKIFRGAFCG